MDAPRWTRSTTSTACGCSISDTTARQWFGQGAVHAASVAGGGGPVAGLNRRYLGERLSPLRHVIGSLDGSAHRCDRDFLPADGRGPEAIGGVLAAVREGQQLPPIEVYLLAGYYYVYDGHHRIAAARALVQD